MNICDKLRAGVTTDSAEESQALALELAAAFPADVVLALHGDLGAGKTTFVQGLARGLGVAELVTSPTFNIFSLYRGSEGRSLLHLDAYRLKDAGDLEDLMIEDFLVSPFCLAVEWPERVAEWLPADAWHLELGIAEGERHFVRLRG